MKINTNINSMKTQEYLRQSQAQMEKSMNRLSSGKRINSAADDAAGLAIATRMKASQSGMEVASRNTNDGISMIQTAEGAMNSVSNILTRMRDLAVQSQNGTNNSDDQAALDKEYQALSKQIDYVADNTKFNGTTLLDGSKTQIDIVTDGSGGTISVNLSSIKSSTLGLQADITSATNANSAISKIDNALKTVATSRADLGATMNRFDYNVENLNTQATAMAASASQIQDADMAKEMSEMTKFKVLAEAGVSMLSQANQSTQNVSKLLQG
ncbi:flagellin [Ectobacillus ponti]|uniref:Flagellin n=1 Tax=Ectobacillus ponti TaxID=2961894 RepID=A0AA41X537_9BACI|nr:flagellin [Ectobacillus ponti]MCP8968857.1 flagellin [Ectobacillus ponti]